jgi:hypothetical protein
VRPTRRGLEIALGALWLLDGALQLQPYMFTKSFFDGILGMANMGLPGAVSTVDLHIAGMLLARPVLFNSIFAALQVALGSGLLLRRTAEIARAISVVWALGVWVIGEGFGGLGMDGTGILTGAPGAALLYAVLGLALWPAAPGSTSGAPPLSGIAVADGGSVLGGRWVRHCWLVLWIGLALLELEPFNHAVGVPGAQLVDIGQGEPPAVASVNAVVGGLVAGSGPVFAVLLGLCCVFVGVGVLAPRTRRLALGVGIALAVLTGLFGQDLGGLLTGRATDPGTGPLLVLFALTLWPAADRAADSRSGEVDEPGSLDARNNEIRPFSLLWMDQKNARSTSGEIQTLENTSGVAKVFLSRFDIKTGVWWT